jgi:hypothetical protein
VKAVQRSTPLWFRLSALGLGILLLLWLPVEDLDERWVVAFGAAISALVAAFFLSKTVSSKTTSLTGKDPRSHGLRQWMMGRPWLAFALAGSLAGLAVPPLAALLMIFKMGLHGHPNPDFTPGQLLAIFYRTPVFILAGLFIGSGIGFYRKK